MANLGTTFNPKDVPESEFDLLPAGDYIAIIESSEIKPTKAGDGAYINCKVKVLDGQFKGRVIFATFNHQNKSAQAEAIGKRQLADLCNAIGLAGLSDTSQLHGKPFKASVVIKANPGYGDKNEVKKFSPIVQPSTAEVLTSQPATGRKPWEVV